MIKNAINDKMSEKDYQESLTQLRLRIRENIDRCLLEIGSYIIIGSVDFLLASLAAAAGYPVASVPLGFADFNGRAFDMHIFARAHEERRIFQVVSAWHATFSSCVDASSAFSLKTRTQQMRVLFKDEQCPLLVSQPREFPE